ncbi:hypothetical protein DYU05_12715 [Mucilaginibacter terrenus]|uniref:histidine kinase n=1 Tax=Mucilaginibacter terrenus TaxID=2482727 RepID=A0A3E2NPT5_9SPHI|nr:histidine kinase dimerization/phospho-acceptor domain-containing protein [Mucilaginibacter terrenus]RFZ83009.1 hypothetical protein DYU05_12715 [Mucilaginibacter terrenus]
MEGSTANMPGAEELLMLKHDIKNQLSNIQLAIEALKFELEDGNEEQEMYANSIVVSARKIDELLAIIPV